MLYVCPTPIGNLRDITLRVLDVLAAAELVLCEDTRRTRKLLTAHGLHAELQSFYQPREEERLPGIVRRLQDGQEIALVTDAGMPGFSDPGFRLVRACIEAAIPFTVLPGPSAVDTAVVASGFPIERFTFIGFLPRGPRRVVQAVEDADGAGATVAAYESPRRIPGTLRVIAGRWPERQVAVCRELTKVHEEVIRGKAIEVAATVAEGVRGEVVLVLAPAFGACAEPQGAVGQRRPEESDAGAISSVQLMHELLQMNVGAKNAAKIVALVSGIHRRTAYELAVASKKTKEDAHA